MNLQVGKILGNITLVKKIYNNKQVFWKGICSCGGSLVISEDRLRRWSGRNKNGITCTGCVRCGKNRMMEPDIKKSLEKLREQMRVLKEDVTVKIENEENEGVAA